MKNAPILHRFEYAGYRLFRGLLRLMPHASTRRVGRVFGSLGHRFDRRHRRVAHDNLTLALPETSDAERGRIVADCFRHNSAAASSPTAVTHTGHQERVVGRDAGPRISAG